MRDPQQRQFVIRSCLGRGGFGEVYRASMSSAGGLQSEVAVKVLRRDIDPRGQAVQRLRDEGRMLGQLNHPTILRVHDLVTLDGRVSLVTEFVDGQDLAVLFRDAVVPVRPLVEILGHVASALDAAWTAPVPGSERTLQLVHRDIKPSNIRISRHGEVKLLDFGIARADSVEREARTSTDMMVGSPAYMAPERYVSVRIDARSDVFSLGATLFEGLARRRLSNDLPVPMLAGLAIDPERFTAFIDDMLRLVPDETPPEVRRLLVDLLAHASEARPDAAALATRCEALADALPGPSLTRWARERTWEEGVADHGELEGRTLTEGTLATARPAEPRELATGSASSPAPAPTSRLGMAAVVGSAGLVALTLAAVGLTVGVLGWIGVGDGGPPAAEVPTGDAPLAAAPPEPEPSPEPEPEPEPAPAPAPVAQPSAADAPTELEAERRAEARATPVRVDPPRPPEPEPRDRPPQAEPAPKPAPEPPRSVVKVTSSGTEIELEGPPGTFTLPAEVPPGTYNVFAKYVGDTRTPAGQKTLEVGRSYHVDCNRRLQRCRWD